MPTRPRTGSGRTKKTAPAVAQRPASAPQPASATEPAHESANESAEVTSAQLERREIPSFSIDRAARIAEAAYWRAERRGFAAGQELDDWLAAEKEVDGDIASGRDQPKVG
jgi:hypothetical protein